MNSTAIVILRFQAVSLTPEHHDLIHEIQGQHTDLLILLCETPLPPTRHNPFDGFIRAHLLRTLFPEITITTVADHPVDRVWSEHVDQAVVKHSKHTQCTIYGSTDRVLDSYIGRFPVKPLPAAQDTLSKISSTEYQTESTQSQEFRKGMLYALQAQYSKVYPTVDIVVFRKNKTEILLGKKSINNKWRCIGGFVDPEDKRLEDAGLRELKEEAGLQDVQNIAYECSAKVPDWRYRYESDGVHTTLFSCDWVSGEAIASDDIDDLQWFPVHSLGKMLQQQMITTEHIALFEHLITRYNV